MNRSSLFKIPYGVFLITTEYEDTLGGGIVFSTMQITDFPTNFAVSIDKKSHTASLIVKSKKCIIGLISEKCDIKLVYHFLNHTGHVENKFDTKYSDIFRYKIVDGMPCLGQNVIYNLICDLKNVVEVDNNYLFILSMREAMEISKDDLLMTSEMYSDKKTKAEHIKIIERNKEKSTPHARTSFVCTVCQYVYNESIPFEELPDDYKCPKCGMNKDYFIEKYLDI